MQLKEVMTRDVDVIRPESTLVEAARKMKNLDVGPIPVCDDNEILGMITDRDITTRAVAEGRDPGRTQVREVMTPDVLYCFEDQDVSEAARLMQQRQVRRILVLNRNREVAGIVSLGDIAVETGDSKLAAKTLEQVSADSDREPIAARLHSNRQTAQSIRAAERSATTAAERDLAGAATFPHDYAHTQPRARDLTGRKTVAGLFPDRRSARAMAVRAPH